MYKLKSRLALCMIATLLLVMVVDHTVFAQTPSVINSLTNAQTIEILLVGIAAGALLAYQQQRTANVPWNAQDFANTLLHTAVATIPIALTAALTQTTLNLFGMVLVFFAAIGASIQLQQARTPTVPVTARKVEETKK